MKRKMNDLFKFGESWVHILSGMKATKNCSKPGSYERMSSGSGSGSGSVLIVKVLRSSTCSFINLGESV